MTTETPEGNPPTPSPTPEPEKKEVAAPEIKPEVKEPEKPVVPEKYEFKLPEGSELAPMLDAFTPTFKKLGLTQEGAGELLAVYRQQQDAQREATLKAWESEAKADKELGPKLQENVAIAAKAIAKFFSPEFKGFLDASGLGNHPEMIRGLLAIGRQISEDKPPSPGTPPASKDAKSLYTHPTSQFLT